MSNEIQTYDTEEGLTSFDTGDAGGSIAVQLSRAEIDQQIATARRFPRSFGQVSNRIKQLSTMSQAAAEECNYALPRGGKPLVGPSVRFAEIAAQQYGNNRVGARVTTVDRIEGFVEAEGQFHDLETNSLTVNRVRRPILDKRGQIFKEDMIIVTGNAACAIAKRNAILSGVPKALWSPAFEASLAAARGDVATLVQRREKALKYLLGLGVSDAQIYASLEIDGVDDLDEEKLVTLRAICNAINENNSMLEQFFPPRKNAVAASDAARGTSALLRDIAGNGGKADNEQPAEEKPAPQQRDDAAPQPAQDQPQEAEQPKQQATGDRTPESRGRKAFANGQPDTAVPSDLKNDEAAVAAWLGGWKAAQAETFQG